MEIDNSINKESINQDINNDNVLINDDQIIESDANLVNESIDTLENQLNDIKINKENSEQFNPYTQFDLIENPLCLATFKLDKNNSFFKGCKWSPDGSCLLTSNNDKILRIFNLPLNFMQTPINFNDIQLNIDLKIKEHGLIYDYCFNPNLNSTDYSTCFLLTTSHGSPIHMFNAYSGKCLNNYVAYTNTEEESFAYSIAINPITNCIYAGYKNLIRIYDINRPGRSSDLLETFYQKQGQSGLISCLAVNPSNTDIFAAGSYSKQLALYSESDLKQICVILGPNGGLTHMKFSHDGSKLFTGSRRDNEIFCWDIRYLSNVLYTIKRESNTNQRIYFDTNYNTDYLATGNTDGFISIFNLNLTDDNDDDNQTSLTNLATKLKFKAHSNCVNGISLHPFYPLLASCSGERKFNELDDSNSENIFIDNKELNKNNSLKLWWLTDINKYN